MSATLEMPVETKPSIIAQTIAFRDAVAAAASIIKNRSPKPCLACILLDVQTDRVVIYSTDLERSYINNFTTVQVESVGKMLINGDALLDSLRLMEDETVRLHQEDGRVLIIGKSSVKSIPLGVVADFPPVRLGVDGGKHVSTLSGENLSRLLSASQWAMVDAEPKLSGLSIEFLSNGIKIKATNGRCAAITDVIIKGSKSAPVMVPELALATAVKIFGEYEEVEVCISDSEISFSSEDSTYISRMLQYTFPSFEGVYAPKSDCQTILTIDRDAMISAARQAVSFTDETRIGVVLHVNPGLVTLRSGGNKGNAELSVQCKVVGSPIKVGINAKWLATSLQSFKSGEVEIWISAPNRAVTINEANHIAVLMPINLN